MKDVETHRDTLLDDIVELTKYIEVLKQEKEKSDGKTSSLKKQVSSFKAEKSEHDKRIESLIREREESLNIV